MNAVIFSESKSLQNWGALSIGELIDVKIIFKRGCCGDTESIADARVLMVNFDVNELHQKLYDLLLGLKEAQNRIYELEMRIKHNLKADESAESVESVAAASPLAVRKLDQKRER